MNLALLPLSAATYTSHALHQSDRPWTETNCWTDAATEMLHALELEPLAAASFVVATDFEIDQWEMFKYPPEDLWSAYGIDVHEMNPYRALDAQVLEVLEAGRLMSVEVDAWFLPDTRGISYHIEHKKTSVIVNQLDPEARTLGYFHNAGYFEAEGEDYDGLFRVGLHEDGLELVPYVELITLDRLRREEPPAQTAHARALLTRHLDRRPLDNPVKRMGTRLAHDGAWLATGEAAFHAYAFVTARQCGAAADMARAFCVWLADLDDEVAAPLRASAEHWEALSDGAKSLQLKMARMARGRTVDVEETLGNMATAWAEAQRHLDALA